MSQHILLYTDDPGLGGVAQYNHSLLCGLAALGYRLTCVQSENSNPLVNSRNELGIQHLWLEFDTTKDFDRTLTNSSDTEKILSSAKPELIIFSDSWALSNFAAKQVAIQLEIPYIVVVGFVAPYPGGLPTEYLDELSRRYAQAKAVIAVSSENLSLLQQLFGLPNDKGQVIYYGRPAQYFYPPQKSVRDRLRQEFDIPSNAVVCFTAARLDAIKGYQYQLAAIEQLKRSPIWPLLYFVWAGAGNLEAQLREAINQLEVTSKVKVLGQRWDISDWMDASDIFVLPSVAEGMPLCVMEAMAKGLPVIASAVSGVPEELDDTGKLLPDPKVDPQATINELAATIQAWCIKPELRYSIGQACKTRAEQLFKEQRMIEETNDLIESALLSVWDYVSPEFYLICPDSCFPNMIVGDTNTCSWHYLRRQITHKWYVDRRQPTVGFLSRDEAHILYNTAINFQGKKALEIGCWLGWSACHLALAGVELDVIEPLLNKPEFYESISTSLEAAGVLSLVNLVAGYSPQKVEELAAQPQRKWSLIFIDGNHDAPAPLHDAIVCEKYAEDDALILFHDLASPDVAQGLEYFRQQGWNTMVYQTMQIMGVAWRGNVEPVMHEPDPKVNWHLPEHLRNYLVSNMSNEQFVNENLTGRQLQAMMQQALDLLDGGKPVEAMQIAEQAADPLHERYIVNNLINLLVNQLVRYVQQFKHDSTVEFMFNKADRESLAECNRQGKDFFEQGKVEQALAAFTKAVEVNRNSVIANNYLSLLYWQRGDVQESFQHHFLAQIGNSILDDDNCDEFTEILTIVQPYTLLSKSRLLSLYSLAKQICLDDLPGNFVECGTYKGGSAALLASVIKRYSLRPRLIYAFDTFKGMPEPTEVDRHKGIPANDTGLGVNTLNAPISENLDAVCQALNVKDIVVPVQGLFAQTLTQSKSDIGSIALLHGDADWYESTMEIFNTLYDSVVANGIIQVDDYGFWEGCRKAIHDFEYYQGASFALRVIDDTGVWFYKEDQVFSECNHWRNFWYLAQAAENMDDVELAKKAARAILKIVPRLAKAEEMLVRLEKKSIDLSYLGSSRIDLSTSQVECGFVRKDTKAVKKKALIFFPHNPHPPRTGAHQRCLSMLSGLKELGYDVTLFGSNLLTDNPWPIEHTNNLQDDLGVKVEVYQGTQADQQFMTQVSASNRELVNWEMYTPPGLRERFHRLFTQLAPDVVVINYALWGGLAIGEEFKSAVRIIDTIDLITLNIQMRQALGRYLTTTPSTPDQIDPSLTEEDFFSKLQLDATSEEYWIYDQYDYTIAIAPREAQAIREHTHQTQVKYVPMTFATELLNNTYIGAPLFAVGPNPFNIQGYLYFTTKVLPLVLRQLPEFSLRVVGSSCQQLVSVDGIQLLGFVSDLKPLYSESRFAVCPLIGGTGQQVKIVEAMALGVPVIALRNVAESSPIQHGINGFIAENAEEFAEYTIQLFRDQELCRKLGQAARETIAGNFSKNALVENLKFLELEQLQNQSIRIEKILPIIIVDCLFFQLYQTGIGRVWRSLLEEWVVNNFAKHIVVLDRAGTAPKIPGLRYRTVPLYDYSGTDSDREMLQQVCDEEGADLFISTYYTSPLSTPSVFMAYDMIPEVMGADISTPMWREKHYGIRHASAYITISDNTARDLVKFFPHISPESVTVALCGVQTSFLPASLVEINSFRTKYGISKPYYIVVGASSGYKNTILFFKAFSHLCSRQGFDIVCTGSGGLLEAEFRNYTSGSVVHMLQLSDEELRAGYSSAVALVYPSKYEGFGLPVLEAIACGCPVITCPNASIPEVAGEAALYVNDEDVNGLANALCDVQKPNVRNSLIVAGLEQAKKFSWSKMANTVSSALINATLLLLNLKDMNLIVFPDWSQPEETLCFDLERLMRAIATHPYRSQITLLVETDNISEEDATLILSSVTMNLLMQEDLDVSEGPEISLVGQLSEIQCEALLPRIHARIVLQENNQAVPTAWTTLAVRAEKIPAYEIEGLSNLTI